MNALDFLVDFIALASASSAPKVPSNKEDASTVRALATASTSKQLVASPSMIYDPVNEPAFNNGARSHSAMAAQPRMTPSFSQLQYLYTLRQNALSANPLHPQSHHSAQGSNQHLQTLEWGPCEFACGAPHQRCYCEYLPLHTVCYAFGCPIPVYKELWGPNQPPSRLRDARQLLELPGLPVPTNEMACEYPCGYKMCHCRYFPLHGYRVADGCAPAVMKAPWDTNEPDCNDWVGRGFEGGQTQVREEGRSD